MILRTPLVAMLLATGPALAGAPEGATPDQIAAFAEASARLETRLGTAGSAAVSDAGLARYGCILDEVARAAGPTAVSDLVTLTIAAADGQENPNDITLRFVGKHGDAYYGIVAECGQTITASN